MKYLQTWTLNGYGVKISDIPITADTVARIEELLFMAPLTKSKIHKHFTEAGITGPELEDYFEYGSETLGLAILLKEVIEEIEHIPLGACDDFGCESYLLYCPSYPWEITEYEKGLTEEGLNSMFAKYINMLTNENLDINYYTVENGE